MVLDDRCKTPRQFVMALPVILGASALAWFLVTALVSIAWSDAFNVLLHPLPFALSFVFFALVDWRDVGVRRAHADPARRELVIEDTTDSAAPGVRRIGFDDALLLRHWRADGENESAAFVVRLLPSRQFHRPDLAGYLLHEEFADAVAERAEQASSERCMALSEKLGIAYQDLQGSEDPRHAVWSHPSLKASA